MRVKHLQKKRKMIKCDLKENNIKCGCQTTSFKWINEEKKAIFFEIPKNASTSIKNLLKQNEFKLFKANYINKNYIDYYKFTIIRNPWDRVVSNWKMFCSNSGKSISKDQLNILFKKDSNTISFYEFIKIIQTVNNHHWEQQIEFLKDSKENHIVIDFVGKMENINEDFEYIKKKLNLKGQLNKINITNHRNYRQYYSEDELKLVNKKYKEDVLNLGYKF